jgi:hypothetical protein
MLSWRVCFEGWGSELRCRGGALPSVWTMAGGLIGRKAPEWRSLPGPGSGIETPRAQQMHMHCMVRDRSAALRRKSIVRSPWAKRLGAPQ